MNERDGYLLFRTAHVLMRLLLAAADDCEPGRGLRLEMEDLQKDLAARVFPSGMPRAYE